MRPERFELPTCCSGGNRSIQLSYGRTGAFSLHAAGMPGNSSRVQGSGGRDEQRPAFEN